MQVRIIGAGLAGSEAAWQLAERGISVELIEMRPAVTTKAHKSDQCAELVCSNSFRGAALTNAVGLLKQELRIMQSLIMLCADEAAVPAGGALAVDRERFSAAVTGRIRSHPLIEFKTEEVQTISSRNPAQPLIIATGPLTSPTLAKDIQNLTGQQLSFFDAISPIIQGATINFEKLFKQSRYDKGDGADYWNIPLNKEQYEAFITEVTNGEKFGGHNEVESDQIEGLRPFEGCMPIEDMVARGPDTLRHGPMKPMGLRDPSTGKRPWGVVQLRQDNKEATLWSLVGFQTRLKHPEQLRIFRMLPGLEEAEFVRLGTVHRNTFINSPALLHPWLEMRQHPGLYFAGQITGVEGYVESTACGLIAGLAVAQKIRDTTQPPAVPTASTAIGALIHYISDPLRTYFQPMNISFGLIGNYDGLIAARKKELGKDGVRLEVSQKALGAIQTYCNQYNQERFSNVAVEAAQ